MTAPTPERPDMADDLGQAYARAHALAGDDRGPAASVRANVLAAAREVAAQAEAKPPLVPVAAPVSDVGGGRAWAWNQLSWRVRSGATFCALALVGLAVVRFDASRHDAANVMVAAADSPLALRVVPPSPPPPPADIPPPKETAPPAIAAERQAALPAAPVDVAPAAAAREWGDAAGRDPERVVARANERVRAKAAPTTDVRPDSPTVVALAAAPPPTYAPAPAPAPAEPRLAAVAPPAPAPVLPEPATVIAQADRMRRVEVTGARIGFSSLAGGQAPGGSAEAAKKASPAAAGSAIGAAMRARPTPLHVAAGADDVEALERLLADPSTRVDATDADGRTPLQVAVMAANARAVRMLLAAGADPDHADSAGATPRSLARTGPSAEIAALLAVRR